MTAREQKRRMQTNKQTTVGSTQLLPGLGQTQRHSCTVPASDGLAEIDHPAAALREDPHNQERIDQYVQYESENAQKQIEELKHGR
jgi:hypothetical protein